MLRDFVYSEILKEFKLSPTNEQTELIKQLSLFVSGKKEKQALLIKGFAGTGKTSIIGAFVKVLHAMQTKAVLLAPTGRAAKVFAFYTGSNAYTIHKEIYIQQSSKDAFGTFILAKNLQKNTYFIIDEASMISNSSGESTVFSNGRLLDDLITYVYSGSGCSLILSGDIAQLPPVGSNNSPALDANIIQGYGIDVIEMHLKEVVRQAIGSGILSNATVIRQLIDNNEIQQPTFLLSGFEDIAKLSGADLIETISDSYAKYSMEETIVVCRSNKRANKFNAGIRSEILGYSEEIAQGDLLMVVKNNYFWLTDNEQISFIANGDIVRVKRIKKYTERYGYRFAEVTVELTDYANIEFDTVILLDTLTSESAALNNEDNKKLFFAIAEDYADIKSVKKRYKEVREHQFFNALQVKFAYAVTCHKAQGGQWKSVFVDQGYFVEDMLNIEFLRWLYTALTRAVKKLYLVNFNKEFYIEKD